jgi:hypothetical protein
MEKVLLIFSFFIIYTEYKQQNKLSDIIFYLLEEFFEGKYVYEITMAENEEL